MEHITGMKSKRRLLLGATCLFFIFFTACGTKQYETTTLEFEKTGAIKLNIVEEWNSDLYSIDEFNAFNEKEVSDYNKANTAVTILSSELVEDKAKVVIQYSDDDAYFDLNNKNLFYGYANKAKDAGYNLTNKVNSVADGQTLQTGDWNAMSQERVIIVSENLDIVCPSAISYVSSGVSVTGTNTATVAITDKLEYIICK